GRDGCQVGFRLRGRPRRRSPYVALAVVRRPEDVSVAPRIGLRRRLPIVRDVEAVSTDPHLPGGGGRAGRRDVAVVLERADRDARRGVGFDIEVVEQGGLKATPIERREGGAGGASEDTAVIATKGNGEWTGLRRECPCVGIGVKPAQPHERVARVGGPPL